MTRYIITSNASVELRFHDGELFVYFCDAQAAQWEYDYGQFRTENKSDIEAWLQGEIEEAAADLAKSIVADLMSRVTAVTLIGKADA